MMLNEKINMIREELNGYFLERSEEIDILLNAVISQKHVFLLGVAGTAKSMLCRAVVSHIEGAKFFDWLMTSYTVPDEIFGALDISKLEQGKYERIITGKLPDVEFAFLDEIFKANSSILNALLKIINERLFDNDAQPIAVPLVSLFSASNELPDSDENLTALYDRLHFRKLVKPISEQSNEEKLLKLDKKYYPKTKITFEELDKLHQSAMNISIDEVIGDLIKIFRTLKSNGIFISDRRKLECRDILKANALINGNTKEVTTEDLTILQHVLWNEPQEIQHATSTVLKISNPFEEKAKEFMAMLDDLETKAQKYTELTEDVYEIYTKFTNIQKTVENLIEQAEKLGKPTKVLKEVENRVSGIMRKMRKEYWGIGSGGE